MILPRGNTRLWRDRWAAAASRLALVEAEAADRALLAAIQAELADAPRPGGPPQFTAEPVCQVLALAGAAPAASGRPVSHWTPTELADEAIKRGLVAEISPRPVGRWLAEAERPPHRVRDWLTTDRPADPDRFDAEVRRVCATQQAAAPAVPGTQTISPDEKTGIQALQRARPTRPLRPGLIELPEAEYLRHGTPCLSANFAVTTGHVVAPTIGPTRTAGDFAAHSAQTVATDPAAEWVFVVDQLTTHQSEALVRLVAEQCQLPEELGNKGGRGSLASRATRAAFLSDPAHRIRFGYTPTHTSWLNQVEAWFSILVRRLLRRGNCTSQEDVRTQILAFIASFNRTLAKPFRWTDTGRPLKTEAAG